MASRYAQSTLHQRDPRSALFAGYTSTPSGTSSSGGGGATGAPAGSRRSQGTGAGSGHAPGNGHAGGGNGAYGYGGGVSSVTATAAGTSTLAGREGYGYAHAGMANGPAASGEADGLGGYRAATPNRRANFTRGQYSDAVLDELESQNDDQVEGILGKVRMLKDMTLAIGDEIRDSSAMADKMNDSFDATRVRLRGTMNRMLLMAERTGVGWKVWLFFFLAVMALFAWVWLF